MSVVLKNLTERQLKFGVFKVALSLTFMLLIAALIVAFFFQTDSKIAIVPIYALLFAVAFSILANGLLAILHILDWFEKRRALKGTIRG